MRFAVAFLLMAALALSLATAARSQTPPPPIQGSIDASPMIPPVWVLFFDWDKTNLTPRAKQIIAYAANTARKESEGTTVTVDGYTDTSGPPDYNLDLSVRRAKAVAVQLEEDGVPAAEIKIHGYGGTHLLVRTGPGMRLAENRRVDISLHAGPIPTQSTELVTPTVPPPPDPVMTKEASSALTMCASQSKRDAAGYPVRQLVRNCMFAKGYQVLYVDHKLHCYLEGPVGGNAANPSLPKDIASCLFPPDNSPIKDIYYLAPRPPPGPPSRPHPPVGGYPPPPPSPSTISGPATP